MKTSVVAVKNPMVPGTIPLILALLAGALLALGFAPISLPLAAPISLAIIFWLWANAPTPKKAALYGFLFGSGNFGVGVSWVYVSIHFYGNTSALLAILITTLFILYLALFPAINGWIVKKITRKEAKTSLLDLLLYPATWVSMEWLRATLLTGFPWLIVGDSQSTSLLSGYAPLFGTFGLSFLVALVAILLVWIVGQRKRAMGWSIMLVSIISLYGGGYWLGHSSYTHPEGKPLTVALVQGNVPQSLKWDPTFAAQTYQTYLSLSKPYLNRDLIIWPEAATPLTLKESRPLIDPLFENNKKVTLLTGAPIATQSKKGNPIYFNGAAALYGGKGRYLKHHLVPFGEFVPFGDFFRKFKGIFDLPMSDFTKGPLKQKPLTANKIPFALFICYEVAYDNSILANSPASKFIVTLSNDAWFGHSFALAQHFQIAKMRAIETGRYHLVATNTGITGIIAPNGHVDAKAPIYKKIVLTGKILPMTGLTPWQQWGNWPLLLLLILIFGGRGLTAAKLHFQPSQPGSLRNT